MKRINLKYEWQGPRPEPCWDIDEDSWTPPEIVSDPASERFIREFETGVTRLAQKLNELAEQDERMQPREDLEMVQKLAIERAQKVFPEWVPAGLFVYLATWTFQPRQDFVVAGRLILAATNGNPYKPLHEFRSAIPESERLAATLIAKIQHKSIQTIWMGSDARITWEDGVNAVRECGLPIPHCMTQVDGPIPDTESPAFDTKGPRTHEYTLWVAASGEFAIQSKNGWHPIPDCAYTKITKRNPEQRFKRGAVWLLRFMLRGGVLPATEIESEDRSRDDTDLWRDVRAVSMAWLHVSVAVGDGKRGRRCPDNCRIVTKRVHEKSAIKAPDNSYFDILPDGLPFHEP